MNLVSSQLWWRKTMPKLGKSLCNFRNVSLLLMEKSKTNTQRRLVKKFLSILWLSRKTPSHTWTKVATLLWKDAVIVAFLNFYPSFKSSFRFATYDLFWHLVLEKVNRRKVTKKNCFFIFAKADDVTTCRYCFLISHWFFISIVKSVLANIANPSFVKMSTANHAKRFHWYFAVSFQGLLFFYMYKHLQNSGKKTIQPHSSTF